MQYCNVILQEPVSFHCGATFQVRLAKEMLIRQRQKFPKKQPFCAFRCYSSLSSMVAPSPPCKLHFTENFASIHGLVFFSTFHPGENLFPCLLHVVNEVVWCGVIKKMVSGQERVVHKEPDSRRIGCWYRPNHYIQYILYSNT